VADGWRRSWAVVHAARRIAIEAVHGVDDDASLKGRQLGHDSRHGIRAEGDGDHVRTLDRGYR
jgi:hypothetical protein